MKSEQVLGGRYRLAERIGAGGMGEVWRALDLRLDTDVAVKCFHDRLDGSDRDRARRQLEREARIAAGLHNPHIVPVLDIADDATYLVMEYVPSRNLRDTVRADGPLTPARAAEIGAQIADALRATHEAGIVHGDVTPANVLIDRSGTARLADFGIARRMAPGGTMTDTGLFRGAPGYLAPEVVDTGEPTPASDMFGLGATLFAAVEGTSPYGEGEPAVLVRRAQNHELLPCRATGPITPVVERLLARSPKRRPTPLTTYQVLHDTAQRAEPPEHAVTDRARLERDPVLPRIADWARSGRHVRALAATTTVLALLVALGVFLATRPSAQASPDGPITPSTPAAAVPAQIGDPRTVDPCALTDAAALGRYGSAQTDADYGNFDRCDVLVQTAAGAQIDVEAQFQGPGALTGSPSPSPGATGTVAVARPAAQSGECDRFVYLTGGYAVVVSAATDPSRPGAASVNLCAVADTATDSAVTAIDRGRLPRRAAPASSLVHADACALLDAAALTAAVPGVDASRYQAGFGDFSCSWASPSGESVFLRFDQNDPLDGTDGAEQQLSGRQAFVQPGGDGGDTDNCLVQVVYRSFDGADGPTEELLYLVVDGSQSNQALCRPAVGLAGAASAALSKG